MSTTDPAAALLDVELTPGQERLLRLLAETYTTAWKKDGVSEVAVRPRSRYVVQQMRSRGFDVQAEYAGLPWVPTRHGPVGLLKPTPQHKGAFDPTTTWALTLAGFARVKDLTEALALAAVDFVRAAGAAATYVSIRPWDTDRIVLKEEDIDSRCGVQTLRWFPYLPEALNFLAPLNQFMRHDGSDGPTTWTIPDELDLFTDCTTPRELIGRVLDLNRPLPVTVAPVPLAPTAVADALDHLDAVWFRQFGRGLFKHQVVDLSTAAAISLPVQTSAELKVSLLALGNIVGRWQPLKDTPKKKGPVLPQDIVDSVVAAHPSIDPDDLLAALRPLEATVLLRNGTAHTRAQGKVLAVNSALGIPDDAPPAQQWDLVRQVVVDAAATLRAVISTP